VLAVPVFAGFTLAFAVQLRFFQTSNVPFEFMNTRACHSEILLISDATRRTDILTEAYRDFSHFFQENTGLVPAIRPW
jgi:hypothetical protein